jgi:NAD(P)H dehydrogenase (quinone)
MYSLRYVGFDVMEPHLVHGVRSGLAPGACRRRGIGCGNPLLPRTTGAMAAVAHRAFNDSGDFEDGVVLRAEATAYSPFIRHRNTG